jgi:hypothetical protein
VLGVGSPHALTGKNMLTVCLARVLTLSGYHLKLSKQSQIYHLFPDSAKKRGTACVSLINLAMYLVISVGILRERVDRNMCVYFFA